MLDFKTHFIINEGGVAGHMSHIYENINLTGLQLKIIFKDLISGKRENITEKVDGQNIFFTWDEVTQSARFARNSGDIKNHGMSLDGLKHKFINHPSSVRIAFTEGGEIIQNTLNKIAKELKHQIFGSIGNMWVNAEIMHTQNPNLIQYSGNYIVLHGLYKFEENGTKNIESNLFKRLTSYLNKQTADQSKKMWSIVGPRLIKIENFNKINGPYDIFCKKIDTIFANINLTAANSLADYISASIQAELTDYGLPVPAINSISNSIIDREKINIISLKKQYGTAYSKIISEFGAKSNIKKIRDRITQPFQEAIIELSVEVLKTLTSYFVDNPQKEILRVKNNLRDAITAIENTKDNFSSERKIILATQMQKLKDVENFCSTVEGIVFEEPPGSGQLYKLTGTFAPVNQILGLVSYGKGLIPQIK